MNYFELHLGDYEKATAHLSACEDGIYGRLMRRYYDTEAPLCLDVKALQRFVRARSKDELQAVETILGEFFTQEPDGWHHKRCGEEIRRYQQKSQKARESVSKRWAKRDTDDVQKEYETDTNVLPTQYEGNTPRARPQTPDTSNQPSSRATGRGERASRLPTDWDPGESGFAFAASQGLVNGRAQAELEKFRDHWAAKPGKDGTKLDWQATWRTWVRRSVEFTPKTAPQSNVFDGAR